MLTKKSLIYLLMPLMASCSASCSRENQDKNGRETTINVASYNIRYANGSDSARGDGWGRRLPIIASLIRYHDFNIFGTQEGYLPQLDSLQALLPGFAYTGVGRDDGKDGGEHSAIFYDTNMFELLDHGDFWLSETPDTPSIGWDAVLPRICSWGHFRHLSSGRELMFFNLHMDHIGERARIESARLVKSKLAELGHGEIPAFLTGDFNVDQTSDSYATIVADSTWIDSYIAAPDPYFLNGTFNSFSTDNYSTSRIDHIFVTPGIEVLKYGVLTDTYRTTEGDTIAGEKRDAPSELELHKTTARTPSDHFPVKITVKI